MSVTLGVEDYDGPIDQSSLVVDRRNFFPKHQDDGALSAGILRYVDEYGRTVFNRLQLDDVLCHIADLRRRFPDREVADVDSYAQNVSWYPADERSNRKVRDRTIGRAPRRVGRRGTVNCAERVVLGV